MGYVRVWVGEREVDIREYSGGLLFVERWSELCGYWYSTPTRCSCAVGLLRSAKFPLHDSLAGTSPTDTLDSLTLASLERKRKHLVGEDGTPRVRAFVPRDSRLRADVDGPFEDVPF